MKKNLLNFSLVLLFAMLYVLPAQAQDDSGKWLEVKTSGSLNYSYQIASATGYDMLVLKVENKSSEALTRTFDIIVTDNQNDSLIYQYENIEVSIDPKSTLAGDPMEGFNPQLIIWDSLEGKNVRVEIIESHE